ncbi:hypothetical protein Bra3105_18450 (plasmid) [Brachybacterium halotolerans subsp. kimchii]|uniref:hypothetical protein n=1 Tax=Brachybacterium halotolerans TaxID=2795215 RepID=UPI001E3B382C|nr:hypothetical protein [Brachybacterium halotolerans]UEJ84613.1 hypothetical protein Bra3105_18450 [Brachybacterium halotolerans subsp. kimchii]
MITRRTAYLALSLTALAAATGCTRDDPDASSQTPVGGTEATQSPTPTELDGVKVQSDGGEAGEPVPASASAQDEDDATTAATATMKAWVQGSTLSQDAWQKKIGKTLTPQAQTAYANRYGYKVEATKLEGTPEILRVNAGSGTVRISTNAATYEVTVVKTSGKWKTSAVTPLNEG